MPASNIILTKVSQSNRPGRLSAEFSALGIKFGHRRPWMVSSRVNTSPAERPMPISNIIPTKLSQSHRPGRLSEEFSAVTKSSAIKFGHRPWMVSGRIKPIATLLRALRTPFQAASGFWPHSKSNLRIIVPSRQA